MEVYDWARYHRAQLWLGINYPLSEGEFPPEWGEAWEAVRETSPSEYQNLIELKASRLVSAAKRGHGVTAGGGTLRVSAGRIARREGIPFKRALKALSRAILRHAGKETFPIDGGTLYPITARGDNGLYWIMPPSKVARATAQLNHLAEGW